MAKKGRLLITRHPRDRECFTEQVRRPEHVAVVADLWKEALGYSKQPAQIRIPGLAPNIEEHGSAGIGRVGRMNSASSQSPEQKAIDGSKGQLAALGPAARARDVVENPRNLGRGKIRIENQSGMRPNQLFCAGGLQPIAFVCRSPILPYDGAVNGFAGCPVPDNGRFALVGNPDCRNAARTAPAKRLPGDGEGVLPDLSGVMLNPAPRRIMLLMLALRLADDSGLAVKQDRTRRARALIDCQDMVGQSHGPTIGLGGLPWKGFSAELGLLKRLYS